MITLPEAFEQEMKQLLGEKNMRHTARHLTRRYIEDCG